MNSLQTRLIVAGFIVLIAFLGLTGFALDKAFRSSAEAGVQATLEAQLYGLLGVVDFDRQGRLVMPGRFADQRLQQPGSGRYAQILDADGRVIWSSPSLLGHSLPAAATAMPTGERRFERLSGQQDAYFELLFGVAWEYASGHTRALTLRLVESDQTFREQVGRFRHSLLGWFSGVGVLLLLMQVLILQWGLRPLKAISSDISRIQAGQTDELKGEYPRELTPLTDNLNNLIRAERARRSRYRDTLADLAHSLKTPLAVLRGAVGDTVPAELSEQVRTQVDRMQEIVDYQLQRASTAGMSNLRKRVALFPTLKRIIDSLQKVYRDKGLDYELAVPASLQAAIEEGDLLELAGNLLDNASKWARHRVRVEAEVTSQALLLHIEDDGPGISAVDRQRILQRGQRADEATPGHGIGLAVVKDIVSAYAGEIDIGTSVGLGGARISLRFPFTV